MILLGVLALLTAGAAIFYSMFGRCCMNVFLALILVISLSQLALLITLFVNLDSSVDKLVKYKEDHSEKKPTESMIQDWTDEYSQSLKIGRYFFLVFVLVELVVVFVIILVRIRNPHIEESESIEDQRAARSAMAQIQLESLKTSTGRSTASPGMDTNTSFYTASSKMYRTVTRKMTEKYGEFTQDPAFQKKWWKKIPGLRS